MPADTYDSTLGLIIQGTGNNNNSWGDTFNNSLLAPVVRAIAGINTIATTSGTVNIDDVTPPAGLREDIDFIQKTTGTISPSLTIEVTNKAKTWIFWHAGTGLLYVTINGGTAIQIPAGTMKYVLCDGAGNLYRLDKDQIGEIVMTGKAAADVGTLDCDGASYVRTEFPDLFGKIGTIWGAADGTHFNVPDFITNNRFLRAAGGSLAVATTQSNQNKAHTHTGSGTTGTESAGHTHTYSATTGTESADHTHSYLRPSANSSSTGGGAFPLYNAGSPATTESTGGKSATHTHSVSGTTSDVSATHTHNFSFTTASDGGTEARPENAAVKMCIRY